MINLIQQPQQMQQIPQQMQQIPQQPTQEQKIESIRKCFKFFEFSKSTTTK